MKKRKIKENTENQKIINKKIPKHLKEIPLYETGEALMSSDYSFIGGVILFITGMIFICDFGDDSIHLKPWAAVIMYLLFLFGLYLIFARKKVRAYREKHIPSMDGDGINYPWFFGIENKHSYLEWADSALAGHYKVGPRGFEFRLGFEKLVFFYNVGISKERTDSQRRYNIFREHLVECQPMLDQQLPKFTKENIDFLDKRCFYRYSRRNQFLVLACNTVAFWFFRDVGGETGIFLTCLVCGLVEFFIFYFLLKGAYYNYLNENNIREALPDDVGFIKDDGIGVLRPYWGFIYLLLLLALNYALQWLLIWM
ncbi:hypothetical protein [Pseudobutyrivibrio sp. LB2011]|uniref:hypothetical protein n=1 Tax=Pseudobutyrivibrio sp. LB2011 TaxID=1408312 RepID=UPI0005D29F35|nr:hypothetical protein [Pseudobutyrivibrio sp. LB2011]